MAQAGRGRPHNQAFIATKHSRPNRLKALAPIKLDCAHVRKQGIHQDRRRPVIEETSCERGLHELPPETARTIARLTDPNINRPSTFLNVDTPIMSFFFARVNQYGDTDGAALMLGQKNLAPVNFATYF
jgi:hypothetical protein